MSRVDREPVKVVIINTEYVETDATSFKSVVQKLTGKESGVVGVTRAHSDRGLSRKSASTHQKGKRVRLMDVDDKVGSYATGNSYHPILMRDLSFNREFERLLKEMPSVDELNRLWADI